MTNASSLERRLRAEMTGDVLFDGFSRGRYATDASFYQIMPAGVVVPRTMDEALRALAIARDEGLKVTPRGGGTSQCGQTVNDGLVVDLSKHLNRILSLDVASRTCVVEPGIVLDDLNRQLKKHGLWFPVDVSTASRATIGGMAGNNSCGGRSLRYGTMRDNTLSMEAALADGTLGRYGEVSRDLSDLDANDSARALFRDMLDLGAREADEIAARFPKVQRRVGGYNLDALTPRNARNNMAHLLVGSEGTLAFTTKVELKLWPVIRNKALGICHFGSFYEAMDAAQHLVKLKPIAVELVDRTMLALGRDIAMFRPIISAAIKGDPDAVLVVEFAEEDQADNLVRLKQLGELMGDLGFGWNNEQRKWGGVVEITEPALQSGIADFRAAGLNVMMSMKQEGKPVSFVEDCAVPLPHLADYTARLSEVFAKHGTSGTMYAHASEGCLHVRPVLNLKLEKDVKAMRAIAEEAFALVREYKGSHSGEHGDGLVRSEFHETMFGERLVADFREVKSRFDPDGVLNPGKIVDAPRMDDRSLFRFKPDYRVNELKTRLDWSAYPGAGGGFQGAVEMCNNNGACRKLEGGVMCPSYRATRNEKDVTRGRANSLRLAISGQLGPDALSSDEMMETLKLCVSCKACRHRMPDRRRHGQDEDRGARRPRSVPWPDPARSLGRLPPALCRSRIALRATRQFAQPQPVAPKAVRALCRHQRAPRPARLPQRRVHAARGSGRAGDRPRSRVVHGHLQSHLRARKSRRRASACSRRVVIACTCPGLRAAVARSAAAVHSSQPVSSTKPGPSSTASWPRSRPLPPAACRSSALSRAAC
ncbi:FAD/FMN-containing dehydrogenase [Bradyrhizobium japonicum]|nr:FAD/FMN-containing dehydrogenase [Bradyrhizobium japonicum]